MPLPACICHATLALLSTGVLLAASQSASAQNTPTAANQLVWQPLPPLPDALGVAGPIVGVHNDVLFVGGGANFDRPVWDSSKRWRDRTYALDLKQPSPVWRELAPLPSPWGYSACSSTPHGIVIIGGNNSQETLSTCWLIRIGRATALSSSLEIEYRRLPDLPEPLANAQACWIGESLFVCTGQTGNDLSTATAAMWRLHSPALASTERIEPSMLDNLQWQRLSDFPGGARSLAQLSLVRRGASPSRDDTLVLVGGRRQQGDQTVFLRDAWLYEPHSARWQRRADAPVAIAAGGAAPIAINQVAVVSGDDGQLFAQTDRLRDAHPGFAKRAWIYDVAMDRWSGELATPANQVTTTPLAVGLDVYLISGEIRPRERTPNGWKISLSPEK